MKKIIHDYRLTPEWQYNLADQLGTKVIDNKIIVYPEKMAKGHSYFTPITPGISALFMDINLHIPVSVIRKCSDPKSNFYIFHFDLSEHVNFISINDEDYAIGSYDKLDLAIIDSQIPSVLKAPINERMIALRILVDKKLLTNFTKKHDVKEEKTIKERQNLYHYGYIDSNSTLLLQSLKNKSIYNLEFESLLKGVSLKILGNFFSKFYDAENRHNTLTDVENNAIKKTRDYLMNNLYSPFPSVIFLAAMAGMSESKYKMAFKNTYNITPNIFFIKEKMALAQKLLKSGEYHTLTDVMYELNYSKLSYFSSKYFEYFNTKPIDDFIKNHTPHKNNS